MDWVGVGWGLPSGDPLGRGLGWGSERWIAGLAGGWKDGIGRVRSNAVFFCVKRKNSNFAVGNIYKISNIQYV